MKRKKGFYSISAVAKMFSIHQQTVRLYEKEGLIAPERSEGNTRLFSEEDVDKLEQIIYLTHELGINLAGVEMVLKLQKQVTKLQREINRAFESTQEELQGQSNAYKEEVKKSATQLMQLKKATVKQQQFNDNVSPESPSVDLEEWEIDYEK